MSVVKIEIVRDAASGATGEAVIRLNGLFSLPSSPVFRIDPIDEEAGLEKQDGWPSGELKARSMRLGEQGVELVIGPEVADAPPLLPGTPVAVSIPSADIRHELRWPNLPVARPVRRGAVVMSGEQRAAELAARAKAQRDELARITAERLAAEQEDLQVDEPDVEQVDEAASHHLQEAKSLARLDVNRKPAPKGDGELEKIADRAKAANVAAAMAAVADKLASPPALPNARAAPPLIPPLQPVVSPAAARKSTAPVASTPKPTAGPHESAAVKPPPLPAEAAVISLPVAAVSPPPPPKSIDLPQVLTRPEPTVNPWASTQRAFGLGFLVAAVLAGISTLALRSDVMGLMSPGVSRQLSAAKPRPSAAVLAEILDVSGKSERGLDATAADMAQSLKHADESLYGGAGKADRDEARFWLRKSLSLGLGDARLVWAMTQLGTLYASPGVGAPDYDAARVLWELASAKGDPVATCFLASMHELGLGVPKDNTHALELYRRSKTNGGCPGIDTALARLSKGAQ